MAKKAVRESIRTCIGCAGRFDKRGLYRIVRSAEAGVRFDPTGIAAGRGAYVCSAACLEAALSKGRLQRALRCAIGKEQARTIADELETALGAEAR